MNLTSCAAVPDPAPDIRDGSFTAGGRILPLACLLLALIGCLSFWHHTPDDTFITLQFAKHLGMEHVFSFNAGHPTYGFTSPLWVLLLALFATTWVPLLSVAKGLGLVCTVSSVYLFGMLCRRVLPRPWSSLAALIWACDPYLWRWSSSGMETSLMLLIITASLYTLSAPATRSRALLLGLLSGLAAITRPEGFLLAAVFLLSGALTAGQHRFRTLAMQAMGTMLIAAPWLLYALLAFGRWLPNTAAAKGGLIGSLGELIKPISRFAVLGLSCYPVELLAATACAAFVFAKREPRDRSRIARMYLPYWLWPLTLLAVYALNGISVISRYSVMASPFLIIIGVKSLSLLLPHRQRAVPAAGALMLAGKLALVLAVILPHTIGFSRGMDQALIPIGRWLNRHTGASATVAVGDIGAIGYYSDRPIIDLGALVSPEIRELRRRYSVQQILDSLPALPIARPDYVVDAAADSLRLLRDSPYRAQFHRMLTGRMPSLGVADRGTGWYYTVYRVLPVAAVR